MKCPECGANLKTIPRKCTECGAVLKKKPEISLPARSSALETTPVASVSPTITTNQRPALLEFPGINRNALPEWRKELSERVREKQERRAREALLESNELATVAVETVPPAVPMLELLPQAEMQPVNPIVEAALKRIERAHVQSSGYSSGNTALATAIAYEEQRPFAATQSAPLIETEQPENEVTPEQRAERTHNLAVVPNPTPVETDRVEKTKKPTRLIGESNDPALNYLDNVPTALLVERREYIAASAMRRLMAAIIDLTIVAIFASPLLALNDLAQWDWQDWRVLALSAGTLLLIGFFYLTIITAFTGRSLGMRLCSLRVVDARNGLIPTGGQSAGRALIYTLSLATAGILSLYVFLDSDRKALQDRFTRTAVIRA